MSSSRTCASSFVDAFEERNGERPSNEDYLQFKNIIQEALLIYSAGEP